MHVVSWRQLLLENSMQLADARYLMARAPQNAGALRDEILKTVNDGLHGADVLCRDATAALNAVASVGCDCDQIRDAETQLRAAVVELKDLAEEVRSVLNGADGGRG
jgi:hypothetical protein